MRIETKYLFGRTKVKAILFVIFSDLRPDNRATYLEDIKSAFNYRVDKNLQTMEDCHAVEGFAGYLHEFRDTGLNISIGEAEKGDYF